MDSRRIHLSWKIYFFEIPGDEATHKWNQYFERNQTRPSCGLLWKCRGRQSSPSIYEIDERGKLKEEQYLMPLQLMNDYYNLLSVLKSWWVLIETRGVTEIKIHSSFTILLTFSDSIFLQSTLVNIITIVNIFSNHSTIARWMWDDR